MHFLKRLFFLLFFLTSTVSAGCSVVIPCHWKHFIHLEVLLEHYASQTQIPNEVVVSLSEAHRVSQNEIKDLKSKEYPFNLVIVEINQVKYAGENRNIGANAARHSILIFQNADDIPHPQRIEIICSLMNQSNAPFLIHQWSKEQPPSTKMSVPEWIPFFGENEPVPHFEIHSLKEFKECYFMHFGNIAVRKNVSRKYKWPTTKRGQDKAYNVRLMCNLKHALIVYTPLLLYRQEYSSFNQENEK